MYLSGEPCQASSGSWGSCGQMAFTGLRRVANCNGVNKCFAQMDLGGLKQWTELYTCGQSTATDKIVMQNNELCGGSESLLVLHSRWGCPERRAPFRCFHAAIE